MGVNFLQNKLLKLEREARENFRVLAEFVLCHPWAKKG